MELRLPQMEHWQRQNDLHPPQWEVHFSKMGVRLWPMEFFPPRMELRLSRREFHRPRAEGRLFDCAPQAVRRRLRASPHFLPMPKAYYLPSTDAGIAAMLAAFDNAANANSGALATKYVLTNAELSRVRQARAVWQWFLDSLAVGRDWAQGFTGKRDLMFIGLPTGAVATPGGPTLPVIPSYVPVPPGATITALLEPAFFTFFGSLVTRIKSNQFYDPADGQLLGIEGADIPPPDPATVPVVTGDLFHSGHPGLTCKKGVFDGYTVWLTRPTQAKKQIGFSTARHFEVTETLPAAGVAEVWTFEVQYRYKGAAFGQISQPLELAVRGV